MKAVCVDPKQIEDFWPHFKDRVKKAITKVGLNEFGPIEKDILAGHALLWLAYDGLIVHAAAVTELDGKFCTIVACGGENLPQFLPLIDDLEAFAKNEGCKGIRIYGRKGWMRVLKNYKTKAVVLERQF